MRRVYERVGVPEGEPWVLGLVLVHDAVRLKEFGVLEAVEAHAVLVSVDVAQRLGDHGIRGDSAAAGVALGNVVERRCGVEDVDVVPLHEAGGTGPFGVADGGVVQEQVSAVVPLVLGRIGVGLAEEIADPGVPVPLVEAVAGVAVGNE